MGVAAICTAIIPGTVNDAKINALAMELKKPGYREFLLHFYIS